MSKPYDLHFLGNECHAWVGGNHFSITDSGYGTAIVPVSVDGIALLAFILADGHLLLTLIVFDESNTLVLRIQNNRLIHSTSPWDIELTGRTLIVRDAPKQILVDILFEVPNTIRVKRGRFLCNGVEILVRPDHVLLTNNSTLFSGNTFLGCAQGIVVGSRGAGSPAAVFLPDINRYLGDRTASVAWAREMLVKPGNGSV